MISAKEAERLQELDRPGRRLPEADCCAEVNATARCSKQRLLEDVPRDQPLCAKEAFGPVAVLSRFRDFAAALREVNDSVFGLQAGIFTRDLLRMLRAWDELEVGGVVIGDVPSWRVDNMPYGGVKDSGLGREGVRYAMEDMTERRLLVIRQRPRLRAHPITARFSTRIPFRVLFLALLIPARPIPPAGLSFSALHGLHRKKGQQHTEQ